MKTRRKYQQDENGDEETQTSRSGGEATILTVIQEVLKDLTMAVQELRGDIMKQLSDFQINFQADIKKQLSERKADIIQQITETFLPPC